MGRYKTRRSSKQHRQTSVPERTGCLSANGTRKLRFDTQIAAYREASYQSTIFDRPTRAYQCPVCDGWHTTKR